jgi:hypothetical protein
LSIPLKIVTFPKPTTQYSEKSSVDPFEEG